MLDNRAQLIGLSQGAWTVLKFAVVYPERVEKLALITPGCVVPDKASFLLRVMILSLFGARGRRRSNHCDHDAAF